MLATAKPDSDVERLPPTSAPHELSEGSLSAEGSEDRLIRWSESEKTTPIAPLLPEWMKRTKTIRDQAAKMVEDIRRSAQPNSNFRRERLVPSDVNTTSDRVKFSLALVEFGQNCFDTLPQLIEYTKRLCEVEVEIDQKHDQFLRQVMVFSVKPMNEFVKTIYPNVMITYDSFMKSRARYDQTRRRGKPNETLVAKKEFAENGRLLLRILIGMPKHQLALAKAVDNYLRAELEFNRSTLRIAGNFKPPDHVKWWMGEEAEVIEIEK